MSDIAFKSSKLGCQQIVHQTTSNPQQTFSLTFCARDLSNILKKLRG